MRVANKTATQLIIADVSDQASTIAASGSSGWSAYSYADPYGTYVVVPGHDDIAGYSGGYRDFVDTDVMERSYATGDMHKLIDGGIVQVVTWLDLSEGVDAGDIQDILDAISGFSSTSASGFSGVSGFSGKSGTSGVSGFSGVSGESNVSGFSGASGAVGTSGFSGAVGTSGFSGAVGTSGYSGQIPTSAISGTFYGVSGYIEISNGVVTSIN